MAHYLTPRASEAVPGTHVQRNNQYSSYVHVILEVNPFPDRMTQIVTNEGTWMFQDNEEVRFPRRPDGSIRDWTAEPRMHFTVEDLAVGDILPSQTDPDPRGHGHEPDPLDLQAFMESRQTVRSVWRHPMYPTVWHIGAITQASDYLGTPRQGRRFDVRPGEALEFPWTTKNVARKTAPPADRRYVSHGPYAMLSNPSRLLMIADHPSGRGRWPKELQGEGLCIEINTHTNLYIIRPPEAASPAGGPSTYYWDDLKYLCDEQEAAGAAQWGRHSKDVHWGKTGVNHNDRFPGARALALAAYREYIDPSYGGTTASKPVGESDHAS